VLAKDGQKLTQGQLDAFDHSAGRSALFLTRRIERAAKIVVDRQQIARELGAAILLCLAAVAFAALAAVFRIGQRAQHTVPQFVTLGAQ
jgi:hypothetical protein